MFVFETVEGNELKVFFRYVREHVPARPHKESSRPHMRPVGTTCMVCDESQTVVGLGYVRCHFKDRFTYKGGRKHALRVAMSEMGLDRDSRKNAWDALLNM